MNKNKKGFTLSEILIVMAIMGVLATILIPVIVNKKPNRIKVMFKKSYYLAEKVVSELINSEDLYPTDETAEGFTNESEVIIGSTTYSGSTKFCMLFADKINTIGDITCTNSAATPSSVPSNDDGTFRTVDGVTWYIPVHSFTTDGSSTDNVVVAVDVNGAGIPNCTFDAGTCPKPDRFSFSIRFDGKMSVSGEKEIEHLQSGNLY